MLYIADLLVALGFTTASYVDDTIVLVTHNNHIKAFLRLQESLYHIQRQFKKCRIKQTEQNQMYVIFITCKEICSPVTLNAFRIHEIEDAKYLGLYLDRRLNQKKTHIYQAETT